MIYNFEIASNKHNYLYFFPILFETVHNNMQKAEGNFGKGYVLKCKHD